METEEMTLERSSPPYQATYLQKSSKMTCILNSFRSYTNELIHINPTKNHAISFRILNLNEYLICKYSGTV